MSAIHSFIRLFVRSFVLSLIPLFVRSFVRSLIRSFVRSLARSLTHSLAHSFIHVTHHGCIITRRSRTSCITNANTDTHCELNCNASWWLLLSSDRIIPIVCVIIFRVGHSKLQNYNSKEYIVFLLLLLFVNYRTLFWKLPSSYSNSHTHTQTKRCSSYDAITLL